MGLLPAHLHARLKLVGNWWDPPDLLTDSRRFPAGIESSSSAHTEGAESILCRQWKRQQSALCSSGKASRSGRQGFGLNLRHEEKIQIRIPALQTKKA